MIEMISDGMAEILQRIEPSFIFCDADILPTVIQVNNEAGLNAKLFTVNENVDGYDSIDSLMVGDGDAHSFV